MKKIIDGIIVVEGTNDVSYLSSLIDATFVSVNGLEIKNIELIKKVSLKKTVYLLTDFQSVQVPLRLLYVFLFLLSES